MSLNLLAYALPVYRFLGICTELAPSNYKKYEGRAPSGRTQDVKDIVNRVLKQENVEGRPHYRRIQKMIRDQNSIDQQKTLDTLFDNRFKVIDGENVKEPTFTSGTDVDDGKYYMILHPRLNKSKMDDVIVDQLYHILNESDYCISVAELATSVAVTTITTFGLGWALLPCLGMEIGANFAVNLIGTYKAETSATYFVNNAKGVQDL
jgi:hypothetical protein